MTMNRTATIVALLVFAAAVTYFLTIGADSTLKLKSSFYQVLSPFLHTGSSVEKQITSVRSGLRTLEELERDNGTLRTENRSLRATNQALRDVEREVNRLRRALDYRERATFRLVPAEIIARDASTWWRTVTINRGRRDNVTADMPVVTDEGLVGKTTSVSDDVAVVLLVSDESCRVAAGVENSREQGIVQGQRITGSLTPMLELNFLTKQANLQAGQKVFTSGVGGVFPAQLMIGTVESFQVRALDGQAHVTPAVDLSHLQDVFVVIGRK